MSGWAWQIDELAAVTARLLATGEVKPHQLVDPYAAMAARDAVVTALLTLVGAIADGGEAREVRDLATFPATHRPAKALHQALSDLPRVAEFGAGRQLNELQDNTLPDYEQAWQSAHRAAIGLEACLDALSRLPNDHAWNVLGDLAEVAAAVPYLDGDLAEAILPALHAGEDLTIAFRLLSSSRHDPVRIVASELCARVRDAEPPAPSGPTRTTDASDTQSASCPDGAGELAEAMIWCAHAVCVRSDTLSVADLKAVSRLLHCASLHAAEVLDRAAPAVAGAAGVAKGLRAVAALAYRLRQAPFRSMAPPHSGLLPVVGELQDQLEAFAGQARRLPGTGAPRDLRRLAGPAVEFAQHLPSLTDALDLSVRETAGNGAMLVPSVPGRSNSRTLSSVTATMGPDREDPPDVVMRAEMLSVTARRLAPVVRQAEADLAKHVVGRPCQRHIALSAAR